MATQVLWAHSFALLSCGRSPASLLRRILRHLSSRGLYLSLQGILAECLRGNRRIICLNHLSSNRKEPCTILINPSLSFFVSFYSHCSGCGHLAPSDLGSTSLFIYFSCLKVTGVKDKWHLIRFARQDDSAACREEIREVPLCSRKKLISSSFIRAKEKQPFRSWWD